MLHRLFKTGNSFIFSLPKEILDSLESSRWRKRVIGIGPVTAACNYHPCRKTACHCMGRVDFARKINEFIEKYRPALEELAK